MANWVPISGSALQFSKNAGGAAAADYYLKFYAAGTTTAISMATTSSGVTTLDKCKIDVTGWAVNGSDEPFIPHIDRDYKLVLYTNAADADADATGSAAWVIDNLSAEGADKGYPSVAALRDSTGNDAFNVIEIESYYEITYPSTTGPKGGHRRHRTGGTNTAPTVGSPVAVSTIGTGTQAGYVWDGDGVEWLIDVKTATPCEFGAKGDGVTDDTTALADCHSYGKSVNYNGGASYVVTDANVIELFDGRSYRGNGCKLIVPSGANTPDPGDGFGRFNNNVFFRNSTAALSASIEVSGFIVDINEGAYNFVGGGSIPEVNQPDSVGAMRIFGNSLANDGTPIGQGGTTTTGFNSGALTQLDGYPAHIHHNILTDCGNGIVAFNSPMCRVHDNDLYFCGVSRDFSSWSNVSAIQIRGSLKQDVHDNYVYATGGTSIFLSTEGQPIETVKCNNNQIVGAGLSAIGSGTRSALTSQVNIDRIEIVGNQVTGFTCAIGADVHGGISITLEDGNNSTIKLAKLDNTIDYLAPWETFNTVDNDVDGSFNTNKTAGNDVGSQYGTRIAADSIDGIKEAILYGEVINHQRAGFLIQNIVNLTTDIKALNCGWSKDVTNNAFQFQQGAVISDIKDADITLLTQDQCRGVNANSSFCTPLLMDDVEDAILNLRCQKSNNQNRAIRLVAANAGNNLEIKSLIFDNPLIDVGYINYIDDSAGANTRNTVVEWAGNSTAMVLGSRSLPLGHSAVGMDYSSLAPKTVTLYPAAYYKGSRILFTADTNSLTITPDGAETIDGAAGSLVLTVGTTKTLYSDGTQWLTLGS